MAAIQYKCSNCDGGLRFEPESQKFYCEYCGSYFEEADLKEQEQHDEESKEEPQAKKPSEAFEKEVSLYTCPSCGAEVIREETTAATTCYYCHNPVVMAGKLTGAYRPDGMIPFTISREQAIVKFEEWIKSNKYLPRDFYKKKQTKNITGIYYPYWVVNCSLQGYMQATGIQNETWRSGDVKYKKTKEYQVIRAADMAYRELMRGALRSNDHKLAEGVQPFDLQQLKGFDIAYLAGFQAEKWDMDKSELAQGIWQEVEGYAEKRLRSTISGYDEVNAVKKTYKNRSSKWMNVLFPAWVLTYQGDDGKTYTFAVNGQTGTVCGRLPISKGRLWALFAKMAVPIFAIVTLLGWLLS